MIARATMPNGRVFPFVDLNIFDAFVKTWREAGYSLEWKDPRTVTICRRPA